MCISKQSKDHFLTSGGPVGTMWFLMNKRSLVCYYMTVINIPEIFSVPQNSSQLVIHENQHGCSNKPLKPKTGYNWTSQKIV